MQFLNKQSLFGMYQLNRVKILIDELILFKRIFNVLFILFCLRKA